MGNGEKKKMCLYCFCRETIKGTSTLLHALFLCPFLSDATFSVKQTFFLWVTCMNGGTIPFTGREGLFVGGHIASGGTKAVFWLCNSLEEV